MIVDSLTIQIRECISFQCSLPLELLDDLKINTLKLVICSLLYKKIHCFDDIFLVI
jgi:hypothetical protein